MRPIAIICRIVPHMKILQGRNQTVMLSIYDESSTDAPSQDELAKKLRSQIDG